MNRDWVLSQLREAQEELSRTIEEMETDSNYDVGELIVAVQHLYHHLNTAWNSRDAAPSRVAAVSEDDFYAWRLFPSDIYLGR
jgi:hypothetical protein